MLFELGLFIGKLGADRALALLDVSSHVKLPTDLAGVEVVKFDSRRRHAAEASDFRSACERIRRHISQIGPMRDRAKFKTGFRMKNSDPGLNESGTRKAPGTQEAEPLPKRFPNFHGACPYMSASIDKSLARRGHLKLDIIAVAGRFSAQFLLDDVRDLIRKYKDSTFTINFAHVTEQTLRSWSSGDWPHALDFTLRALPIFEDSFRGRPACHLNVFDYDTVPQRHGMLINEEILYMSWTDWRFDGNKKPEIRVGQCEYRLYEASDLESGKPRIMAFLNFMERIKVRHLELSGAKSIPAVGNS